MVGRWEEEVHQKRVRACGGDYEGEREEELEVRQGGESDGSRRRRGQQAGGCKLVGLVAALALV